MGEQNLLLEKKKSLNLKTEIQVNKSSHFRPKGTFEMSGCYQEAEFEIRLKEIVFPIE